MDFNIFGKSKKRIPSKGAEAEARQNPGGWVYEIQGDYTMDDDVPPHAVIGAWKVNEQGQIVGDFMENPNFTGSTK